MNQSPKTTIFKKITSFVLITVTVALLGFCSIYIYQDRAVVASLFAVKPEPFTELYFENSNKLPTKEVSHKNSPPNQTFSFKFTVHNLENKDVIYPYEVYTVGDQKIELEKGELVIKKNAAKTISEIYTMPLTFPATKVVVNLINKNQSISFWMEEQK